MASNKNLHKAHKNKKDEFYTQLVDIERELRHYQNHCKNVVFIDGYANIGLDRLLNLFGLDKEKVKILY